MIAIILFALLTAVLLWFLVGSKGKWWAKVPLIIIIPFLGFLFHQIPDTYKGWPTVSKPPVTSTFVGGIVEEPDAVSHSAGAIYLWLIPAKAGTSDHGLGYKSHTGEPRAYQLPYTRQLHKSVDQANGILKHGGHLKVTVTSKTAHSGAHVPKFLVRFYNLPPGLPPKAVPSNP